MLDGAGTFLMRYVPVFSGLLTLVLCLMTDGDSEGLVDVDDWADVQAALGGDDSAYGRLVERYQNAIGALMWKFTRRRERQEELVQRTFVEAYFSLDSYRGEGSFLAWLRTIGTRVGYKFWKERDRKPGEERESLEKAIEDVSSRQNDDITPEQAAELLHRLLGHLEVEERLVLTLFYLEDRSMSEIGHHLECSEGAAKMRVHRAREKLRDVVQNENLAEEIEWNP